MHRALLVVILAAKALLRLGQHTIACLRRVALRSNRWRRAASDLYIARSEEVRVIRRCLALCTSVVHLVLDDRVGLLDRCLRGRLRSTVATA